MSKNINLNDIIARKKQGKMDRFAVSKYESKMFESEIEIRKIPFRKFMDLQEIAEDDHMEGLGITLFECLPMFKDIPDGTMEFYEVSTPTDLVFAVFEDNIGEMMEIMEEINRLYGIEDDKKLADEIEDEVKN